MILCNTIGHCVHEPLPWRWTPRGWLNWITPVTVVLLWSDVQDVVYGKVVRKGKSTLIGSPPPAVAAELETLWKSEFRSQPR